MDFEKTIYESIGNLYLENAISNAAQSPSADDYEQFAKRMVSNYYGRTGYVFRFVELEMPHSFEKRPKADSVTITCVSSDFTIGPVHSPDMDTNGTQTGKSVADKKRYDYRLQSMRDNCRIAIPGNRLTEQDWENIRQDELKQALSTEPDIICFGELAYPLATGSSQREPYITTLGNYGRSRSRFDGAVEEILKQNVPDRRPFVFMGSYHCPITLYNIGVIFPYGRESKSMHVRESQEYLDPRKRRDDAKDEGRVSVQLPLQQIKRFPARSAGEETRVPAGLRFHTYRTEFGTIAILICSDILDLNQFLGIARRNHSTGVAKIDYILVPSYNENPVLLSMCRELSFIANTSVVYVNHLSSDNTVPKTTLFVSGHSHDELPEALRDAVQVREKSLMVGAGKRKKTRITSFRLNQEKLARLKENVAILTRRVADPSLPEVAAGRL